MRVVLRILGGVASLLVAALMVVFIGGRFSDGPMGFFSGGPLESGEVVTAPVDDWSFVRDVETIEFQLVEPPRSRTVWIVYNEDANEGADGGAAFIPCGLPNFRLWKQWPREAVEDGRAVLRIEGRRYPVQLTKIEEPALRTAVLARVTEKYPSPPGAADGPPDPDAVWFFRIDSRPAG
jgi:hypothetical protein